MPRMPWEEAYKRTRSVLRLAYPDRFEDLLFEMARWQPGLGVFEFPATGRWSTGCDMCWCPPPGNGTPYVYADAPQMERLFTPYHPTGTALRYCRECVLDLVAWADERPRRPLDRPGAEQALAEIVRALKASERARVEEVIAVLEKAAVTPRDFEAASPTFCAVCVSDSPNVRYARRGELTVCAACARLMGQVLQGQRTPGAGRSGR